MAEYPYMPLWTDAYLADTTHLSRDENGGYLLLLMAAWRSPGCRLRDDDVFLARIVKAGPREWRRLRPILEPFWTVAGGFWSQKRLTLEHVKCSTRLAKCRAAAHAKHLKDKETHHAEARPMHMQSYPDSSVDKESTGAAPNGAVTGLDGVLKTFLYRQLKVWLGKSSGGEITKALDALHEGGLAEVLAALEREKPAFPMPWFKKAVAARAKPKRNMEGMPMQ